MSDIFISYSSEDRDRARQLAQALRQEGWSVWWDRKIAAGKSYQRVIESELDAADCAIVIWSKNSVYSDWVVAEAEEGRTRSILVPVSIDDAKPPLVFRQIQTADLSNWDGNPSSSVFRQLVNDIRPLISAPTTATPEKVKTVTEPEQQEAAEPPEIPDGKKIKWFALAAVVLIGFAALVAWRYSQTGGKPKPAVEILTFSVEPEQITEGESATLRWSTANAVRVVIGSAGDPNREAAETFGSKVVSPKRTTEFVLTAQGKEPYQSPAIARRTLSVIVPAIEKDPQIIAFDTDRRILIRGDSTALHWETDHAARVELDDAIVNPRGDIKIRPELTTTYRLTVFNKSGRSNSRALTITVEEPPRDEIAEIQELLGTLGYDAGTADGLPGPRTRAAIEAFQNENGLAVTGLPSRDLAERLQEMHGSVPAPKIVVFKSERPEIKKGESLNLFWETVNADRVSLSPLGKVEPSGKRLVQPSASTEYELLAFNRVGRSVRKTVLVTVESAAVTSRFLVLAGAGRELEDPRVIEAIQIGMPLQSLVEKFVGRSREPRAFFEIPLGSKRIDARDFPYNQKNLARGKQLLAEAGFPGGMKAMLLYTKRTRDLSKAVMDTFDRIGIAVSTRSVTSAKARRVVEAYVAKSGQPAFLLELQE